MQIFRSLLRHSGGTLHQTWDHLELVSCLSHCCYHFPFRGFNFKILGIVTLIGWSWNNLTHFQRILYFMCSELWALFSLQYSLKMEKIEMIWKLECCFQKRLQQSYGMIVVKVGSWQRIRQKLIFKTLKGLVPSDDKPAGVLRWQARARACAQSRQQWSDIE